MYSRYPNSKIPVLHPDVHTPSSYSLSATCLPHSLQSARLSLNSGNLYPVSIGDNFDNIGWSSENIGDPSNLLGANGLVIRIVGVGRDGDVAVDENVGVGLSGSISSLFLGRSFDRNIFFRPARLRFGAEGGIMESLSRIGDKLVCGDSGDGGARVAGKYPG